MIQTVLRADRRGGPHDDVWKSLARFRMLLSEDIDVRFFNHDYRLQLLEPVDRTMQKYDGPAVGHWSTLAQLLPLKRSHINSLQDGIGFVASTRRFPVMGRLTISNAKETR